MRQDNLISAGKGRGIDVAVQRADDLDNFCLDFIHTFAEQGKPVRALDVGCGRGGQTIRMAEAGAEVVALDLQDHSQNLAKLAAKATLDKTPEFIMTNMEDISNAVSGTFDVIICQRTIHYLPYANAQQVLRAFEGLLNKGGKLFLSASGIGSELSTGYPHKDKPVSERFTKLEETMAKHHDILEPVCLYSEDDMKTLIEPTSLVMEKLFSSPFGNIKAVITNG